jgi:hypothetical protein
MNSWTWKLVVAPIISLTVWLPTSLAAAQPGPPAGPPPEPMPEPAPAPAVAPMPVAVDEPVGDSGRPTELAIAIGVGYTFPTSLQTPNTTSVRLRLVSGLTFEPQLVLATTSNDVDNGTSVTNNQSELTLGSLVRYPLKVRRKVDLELLGSAAISSNTVDPNGDDNNRTITSANLGYGVGLAYWFSRHCNLSLSATNPLIAYVRTRQEMGAATTTVNKTTTFGLVFDPRVALMIHLYD